MKMRTHSPEVFNNLIMNKRPVQCPHVIDCHELELQFVPADMEPVSTVNS